MDDKHSLTSVVVGIDGSQAAIGAAFWAIDEAVSRAVPLRLGAVTKDTHASADDYYRDVHYAEKSLRVAQAAVESMGRPVKIETETLHGPPGPTLVEASRDADLICVGSVGIGRYARALLGSTATELAQKAHCPVAVVRTRPDEPPRDIDWIVVVMSGTPDNDAVVEHAMGEAKLRQAPVLALGSRENLGESPDHELDSRVQKWRRQYPDVRVYPIVTRADMARFLDENDLRVQLAVIGSSDANKLAHLVGPHGHPIFRHPECSVLVVR
jgi:nucleotide-binding universal stress UspA family protein